MDWFNCYGLIAVAILLIPNILFAIFDKGSFENRCKIRALNILEQVGRYGCFIFIVFNIPFTYLGFWFGNALTIYLSLGGGLLLIYLIVWAIFRKGRRKIKMLWLSVIPTVLFLFCGIIVCSVPLMIFSILFGIGHISVSLINAE